MDLIISIYLTRQTEIDGSRGKNVPQTADSQVSLTVEAAWKAARKLPHTW